MKIKTKIVNHFVINGEKKTSEKILLKSFKELQKFSRKQSKMLIKLALVCTTPVFVRPESCTFLVLVLEH